MGRTLTLVVMAAGIGSRYVKEGGATAVKQLEPVGPEGATILEYNAYDAWRAGIRRVVLVISKAHEPAVRSGVGARLARRLEVSYAFQGVELPGAPLVPGRQKPWGTAAAALAAAPELDGPFLLVNADDFYGARSVALLAHALEEREPDAVPVHHLVAYPLGQTLSETGPVSRGLCEVDPGGHLRRLMSATGIERRGERIVYRDSAGTSGETTLHHPASMNLWGFEVEILAHLESELARFAADLPAAARLEAELGLPDAVQAGLAAGALRVRVHETRDRWLGLTHAGDLPRARAAVAAEIARGVYPEELWS